MKDASFGDSICLKNANKALSFIRKSTPDTINSKKSEEILTYKIDLFRNKFSVPKKILIQYDFELGITDGIYKVLDYIKPLNLHIIVIDVAEKGKYPEMVLKSEVWKQTANNYIYTSLPITTKILTGNEHAEELTSFILKNNVDLLAIPKHLKVLPTINIFPKNLSQQLVDTLEIPVILY